MGAPKKKRATKREPKEEPAAIPIILRPHQAEAYAQFQAGKRDQYHIWNRRAGKDWYGMYTAREEARRNVGTYWHLLPKHVQARRAVWNGIDHVTGRRFIELMFPDAVAVNNTEMFIELESGSTWQLLGSDNYDRMVGSNPRGVVYSEWALCDPRARDYINPILRANNGWSMFITTFRGRNHAYQMYELLKDNPDWYTTRLTVDDTKTVTAEDIAKDRAEGISERRIKEEYYCIPVPPASLGPYARTFDSLTAAGNLRDFPDSVRVGAVKYLAFGESENYLAMLECFVRGNNYYLRGGVIQRDASPHELLAGHAADVVRGGTVVAAPATVVLVSLIARPIEPASIAATCFFLERATVSPTSVLAATLSNSLEVMLGDDEEPNVADATAAVYDALERMTAVVGQGSNDWSQPIDYRRQDRKVIGGTIRDRHSL